VDATGAKMIGIGEVEALALLQFVIRQAYNSTNIFVFDLGMA